MNLQAPVLIACLIGLCVSTAILALRLVRRTARDEDRPRVVGDNWPKAPAKGD